MYGCISQCIVKCQYVLSVLQVTARDVAELGATDGAVAFISDSDLAGLDGEEEVGVGRCDNALPWCCV